MATWTNKAVGARKSAEKFYKDDARLERLNYRESLVRPGFLSLEHRRVRDDLINVCKIMRGIGDSTVNV